MLGGCKSLLWWMLCRCCRIGFSLADALQPRLLWTLLWRMLFATIAAGCSAWIYLGWMICATMVLPSM
jgi:hypothetical protein